MAAKIHPVAGVALGAGRGGLRSSGSDVAVISFPKPVPTAAVFTRNRFAAAPVQLARAHLRGGLSHAWLINSGNANCGTGQAGMRVARGGCEHLAGQLGINPRRVVPFSTGVIMEQLSASKLHAGIDKALRQGGKATWLDVAKAIMTTDTVPKLSSRRIRIKGGEATITGIAKGSGMIHPDMATMLSFIATDARLPRAWLAKRLKESVAHSFNAISVDGDTSTNDAVAIAATGAAGLLSAAEQLSLAAALEDLCAELAGMVVADGEGATMVCSVTARGFASDRACRAVADSVARSPLIKTMLHARDANLGRLLMAIGKAPARFDPDRITIGINGKIAFRGGRRMKGFTEAKAAAEMRKEELEIDIAAGSAHTIGKRLFCDLSKEYVSINAEYRT